MKFYFLFLLILLITLVGCSSKQGEYDSFAQCLTEKGVKMYGTEWCSHCKNHKDECSKARIEGYPTWNIDGINYPGEQQLYKLASLTGCSMEPESTVCDIENKEDC